MKLALILAAPLSFVGVARADRIDDLEQKVVLLQSEVDSLKAQISQTGPAASGPTAAPTAAVKVKKIDRYGPWNVAITANVPPEPGTIQQKIADEEPKLPRLQKTFDDKQERYQSMAGESVTSTVRNGTDGYGNGIYNTNTRQKYSPSQLGQVSADAARAKEELQSQKQLIAKLKRELDAANNGWTAAATADDGSSVELSGQGTAAKQLVMQLQVGKRYRVEGTSTVNGGTFTIAVRVVTPLPDSP